jgi:hypothetical protein
MERNIGWQKSNFQIFWAEIAPCNHILQIYEDDKVFLDSLEGFVGSGILAGDSVIIIGTNLHLKELNNRLLKQGFDLNSLKENNQYIPLDALETLSKFMINGWPDEALFNNVVQEVIKQARSGNRKIRAFGEMVAILWAQGNNGATVRLEHLWNEFQEREEFSLFCAYPKIGFTDDPQNSIMDICKSHSQIIGGWAKPSTEIYYQYQTVK